MAEWFWTEKPVKIHKSIETDKDFKNIGVNIERL